MIIGKTKLVTISYPDSQGQTGNERNIMFFFFCLSPTDRIQNVLLPSSRATPLPHPIIIHHLLFITATIS
jgi:hypothetical protein